MIENKLSRNTKIVWNMGLDPTDQTLMRYSWNLIVIGEKEKAIQLMRELSIQGETKISDWRYVDSAKLYQGRKPTGLEYIGVVFKTDKPTIDFPEKSQYVEIVEDKFLNANTDLELGNYVKRLPLEKRAYKTRAVKI